MEHPVRNQPWVPHAGGQDDGSLHKLPQINPSFWIAFQIAFPMLPHPPARSAGMNDCVSRVCVIMGWEWDGIGIGMAIPGGAACVAGIGDPNPKT